MKKLIALAAGVACLAVPTAVAAPGPGDHARSGDHSQASEHSVASEHWSEQAGEQITEIGVPAAPPVDETGVLAIAYINVDHLDGFSPDDVMIASLVDLNEDGVASAGDLFQCGAAYPLDFQTDGARGTLDSGAWQVAPGSVHVSGYISVSLGDDWVVQFTHDNEGEFFSVAGSRIRFTIFDSEYGGNLIDVNYNASSGPCGPDTFILNPSSNEGDDPFFDVDVVAPRA